MVTNRKWRIVRSERCAWRAVYLYRVFDRGERCVLHVGFDPNVGTPGPPQIFGGWHFRLMHPGRFRITLPYVRFLTSHRWKFLRPAYRWQQSFLCWIDGRHERLRPPQVVCDGWTNPRHPRKVLREGNSQRVSHGICHECQAEMYSSPFFDDGVGGQK